MSVEKKVPEIRFTGFSGAWVNKPIGDICGTTFGGGTPSTREKNFWQGDIPWIQSSDLKEGCVSSVTAKKYITKAAVNKSATKLISGNSIAIVTRVGVGKLSLMGGDYATSQDFLSLSDLKVDAQYSAYVIWKLLQIEKEQVQGTSIKGITKEELLSKLISYPIAGEEQTAIGNYFQKLDTLINQHQQKHDKLSNIKKAMLEKMFPKPGETIPEIRFKGFGGEWEEKELGELAEIVRGASPRPIEDPKWFDSQSSVGWLRIRDVTEQDGRIHYLEQRISKLGQEKTRVLHEKHLLLSIAASVGKPVVNYVETGVHDGFLIFKKPLFELEFMYQWLKSFETKWQQFGQPGSQVNLNSDIVKNLTITIPTNEEQTAIGSYFQKLDVLINQHQQQITKLNNIKQACLSKMFV